MGHCINLLDGQQGESLSERCWEQLQAMEERLGKRESSVPAQVTGHPSVSDSIWV